MVSRKDPETQGALEGRMRGLVIVLLLTGFALRLVQLGALPFIGDEAYYRLWSRQLALSYYDHPAGIALMIRISTALAGGSEFGVRWLNATLSFLTIALAIAVGRRLLSRRAGLFAAAGIALGAPYLVVARFVYTDVLHLIGVLLNLWAFSGLLEARDRDGASRDVWAAAFGMTLILLLNTKYSAYLYGVALVAWILWERRELLRDRAFWISVGLGVLGLLPVVLWNASHGWISFRWQLAHFGMGSPGSEQASLLRRWAANTGHAAVYLTPPLFLAGILGLGRLRNSRERLLTTVALVMLLPVALSAANSPRNLTTGWVVLLLLAGARLRAWSARRLWTLGLVGLLLVGILAYGVGTVAALSGRPSPLRSSVVPDILRDAVGWRALGGILSSWEGAIFAVDYSLAGQIAYYAGRPVVTPWGQYRLWDASAPEVLTDPLLVVSRGYLPETCLTAELRTAFDHVEGPEVHRASAYGVTRVLRVWRAEGLRVPRVALAESLDFLSLWEICR